MEKDDFVELRPAWINFNKEGDYVTGTLIDVYKPRDPDQFGKIKNTYTLLVTEGKWFGGHKDGGNYLVDTVATTPEAGTVWKFSANEKFDQRLTTIKIGQKVLFKLDELRKSKLGAPAKIISAHAGPMDQVWLAQQDENKGEF